MNASETMLQFVLIGIIVGREPGRTLNPVRGLVVLLSVNEAKEKEGMLTCIQSIMCSVYHVYHCVHVG